MKSSIIKTIKLFGPIVFSLIPVAMGVLNFMNIHFSIFLGLIVYALACYHAAKEIDKHLEEKFIDPFYENREYDIPNLLFLAIWVMLIATIPVACMFY